MARWSSPGWGTSERTVSVKVLIVCMIAVLIVGGVLGYMTRGATSPSTKLNAKAFRQSDVIDPSTDAIQAADESPDGAVRAVTSFLTGLPQVSLETPQQEAGVLDTIMDPKADPSVRIDVQNTIDTGRVDLLGTGAFSKPLTSKLLFTPASYRVDMLAKDRARVQIWLVVVTVDGSSQTAVANWATDDIVATWTDHWRISSLAASLGPTPQVQVGTPDGKSDPYAVVINRINGFTAYRYAVGSVNQ